MRLSEWPSGNHVAAHHVAGDGSPSTLAPEFGAELDFFVPSGAIARAVAQIEFAARSELNAHILSKMVFAVENNIEVDHRDSGAANEAANWSSFPEFNANALHNDTGAEAGADEETIMTGAEAVVAADRSSSTQDERRGLSSNLRNLFHDPSSRAQSKTSLDIVA